VRDVVVRVPNWLGDSVMARPFVATLAERHGTERIQVVAHPRVAEFWRAWPELDVAALGRDAGSVTGMIRSARSIRRRGTFRLGYLLSASFSSALLFALAGVRERIGFASDARSWLLTEPVPRTPAAGTLHYSTEMLRLLGPGATAATRALPALDWPKSERRRTRDRLRALGLDPGSYAVVAVGAAGSSKRYAPGNWQQVVAQLRADGPVVLVGINTERPLADRVAAGTTVGVHNLCGETSLAGLALLLETAAVFIGVDSGAAHLAAHVGCPVVAIFGPGDPVETRPLGPAVEVVRERLWCAPCRSRLCLRTDIPSECMERIAPARVSAAAQRLVALVGPLAR